MNYKQFYEDIDDLFYRYRLNKYDKKNLYNSVDNIFEKCCSLENELSSCESELEDLKKEKKDIEDNYNEIYEDYNNNLSLIDGLKEKINEYEDILKEILPEYLI